MRPRGGATRASARASAEDALEVAQTPAAGLPAVDGVACGVPAPVQRARETAEAPHSGSPGNIRHGAAATPPSRSSMSSRSGTPWRSAASVGVRRS